MEEGQLPLRRVFLIGGVTRNAAPLEALRLKLAGTELVVLQEVGLLPRDRHHINE